MPPLVIVIQATVLVGVHEQLEPVVTEILLLRPVDGAEKFVGDTLYVHCASAARTSSPHHETNISAIRTPQRRRVIHHPLLNGYAQESRWECAERCIPLTHTRQAASRCCAVV
jgi:hypothetical protein